MLLLPDDALETGDATGEPDDLKIGGGIRCSLDIWLGACIIWSLELFELFTLWPDQVAVDDAGDETSNSLLPIPGGLFKWCVRVAVDADAEGGGGTAGTVNWCIGVVKADGFQDETAADDLRAISRWEA